MARQNKYSKEKFEERILNELNMCLRRDLGDSRFSMISITKVELNKDYAVANVYWDTFDDHQRGDAKEAIGKVSSRLRKLLSTKLDVRHVPELKFHYDAQFVEEAKITKLLNENAKTESDE